MPSKRPGKAKEPAGHEEKKAAKRGSNDWEERLRLVGDARFIDVEWSGRDQPCWPLPKR